MSATTSGWRLASSVERRAVPASSEEITPEYCFVLHLLQSPQHRSLCRAARCLAATLPLNFAQIYRVHTRPSYCYVAPRQMLRSIVLYVSIIYDWSTAERNLIYYISVLHNIVTVSNIIRSKSWFLSSFMIVYFLFNNENHIFFDVCVSSSTLVGIMFRQNSVIYVRVHASTHSPDLIPEWPLTTPAGEDELAFIHQYRNVYDR